MPANKKLLILAGDGIGPEVMAQVKRVLDWFAKNQALSFDTEDELVGGCSIDKHGVPLTDAAMEKAMKADAVLLARSVDRSGTTCRSNRSRSAGCCACARIWSCSPTCAPPSCSTRWPTLRASSGSWWPASTS